MTDSDSDATGGAAGGDPADPLDDRREQAVAALRDELARAAAAALDRGYTVEAVDAYLDTRTDRLCSTIANAPRLPAEDVAHDPSDSG